MSIFIQKYIYKNLMAFERMNTSSLQHSTRIHTGNGIHLGPTAAIFATWNISTARITVQCLRLTAKLSNISIRDLGRRAELKDGAVQGCAAENIKDAAVRDCFATHSIRDDNVPGCCAAHKASEMMLCRALVQHTAARMVLCVCRPVVQHTA